MSDQNIMFIFPGQGSQYAGMGSDLCAEFSTAQRVYEEANDALGYDIQTLSANGLEEELGLTRHTHRGHSADRCRVSTSRAASTRCMTASMGTITRYASYCSTVFV